MYKEDTVVVLGHIRNYKSHSPFIINDGSKCLFTGRDIVPKIQ